MEESVGTLYNTVESSPTSYCWCRFLPAGWRKQDLEAHGYVLEAPQDTVCSETAITSRTALLLHCL